MTIRTAWHPLIRLARQGWAAIVLASLASAAAAQSADDPPGRVGRMAETQGTVWVYDAEPGEWIAVQRNRPLTSGDRISVEDGGRAELRIGSTTVRLDSDTDLEIRRLDDARIDLALHRGSAALRVRSSEMAREIELATAEGRFTPRRSGHYRVDRRGDASFATAWSGELRFENRDSALAIPPGRRAELWQDGAQQVTHYTWHDTERDAFSDWVARDNRDEDRSTATRYVSPEMTGWEDLDAHGRWDQHPEYGAVWMPTVVASGWAPYRYGHWSWVRPWGWTWVDDASWGFAPFHYGRWVHWGGRWAWAPGYRVARPVYSPALVAWIGGPNVSVSIGIGGSPMVGWVPLAPYDHYRPYYQVSPRYIRNVNPWIDRHPPRQSPGVVPTGPIMYGNRGVPGAVTMVPQQVVMSRQPVYPSAQRLDPDVLRRVVEGQRQPHAAPPAPPTRVVAEPGGAVRAPDPARNPAWPRGRAPETRAPWSASPGLQPRAVAPVVQPQNVPQMPPTVAPRAQSPRNTEPAMRRPGDRDGERDVPREAERRERHQAMPPQVAPQAAPRSVPQPVPQPQVVPQARTQPVPVPAPTRERERERRQDDDRRGGGRDDRGNGPRPMQQVN